MAEISETDQFIQLKKALASHTDLNTIQNEGGDSNLGELVENFLKQVEKTGIPSGFTWEEAKSIIIAKFDEVAKKFEAERPISSLEPVPNVDNYTFDEYRERIVGCLNRFEESSPFTLGRICELLLDPRKHYDRGDKFLRAFEKCVTVTSTSDTNGNGHVANGINGHENGANGHENGSNGHVENGANGHHTNGENGAGTPMELNASQEVPVSGVESGNKQEDAVSSSVIDEHQENGQGAANTTAVETNPEPAVVEGTADNTATNGGTAKRQTDEPETASKKARVEEEGVVQDAKEVENGQTEVVKGTAGEAIQIDQEAVVDQGTAV